MAARYLPAKSRKAQAASQTLRPFSHLSGSESFVAASGNATLDATIPTGTGRFIELNETAPPHTAFVSLYVGPGVRHSCAVYPTNCLAGREGPGRFHPLPRSGECAQRQDFA